MKILWQKELEKEEYLDVWVDGVYLRRWDYRCRTRLWSKGRVEVYAGDFLVASITSARFYGRWTYGVEVMDGFGAFLFVRCKQQLPIAPFPGGVKLQDAVLRGKEATGWVKAGKLLAFGQLVSEVIRDGDDNRLFPSVLL